MKFVQVGNMRIMVVPPSVRPQRHILFALCEAQNWRCCYCGVEMTRHGQGIDRATTEHVIPKSQGGEIYDWNNQVASCSFCNHNRGSLPWQIYFRLVQEKGRWRAAAAAKQMRLSKAK